MYAPTLQFLSENCAQTKKFKNAREETHMKLGDFMYLLKQLDSTHEIKALDNNDQHLLDIEDIGWSSERNCYVVYTELKD